MMQGMNGTHDIQWLTIMMLIHFVFTLFSLFFRFAGRKFHSYLGYGRIIGTNLRVGIGTARMDRV